MGRPTIGDERNEVVRKLVREIRAQEFEGNLSRTAEAVGVKPGTLSDFLNNNKGSGMKILDGLTKHLQRSMDQILASGGDLATLRGEQPTSPPGLRQITFEELPNWRSLLTAAKRERPHLDAWVWERLATAKVWLEGPVTAAFVADCADVVSRNVAPPSLAS